MLQNVTLKCDILKFNQITLNVGKLKNYQMKFNIFFKLSNIENFLEMLRNVRECSKLFSRH